MPDRLEMLETMIAKGSEDPFVHYARALELRSRGKSEEGLRALREVAERFPEYVPTYLMAGQIAEDLGEEESARDFYARGLTAAEKAGESHAASELEAALSALD